MNMAIFMVLATAGCCGSSFACDGPLDDCSKRFLAARSVQGHFDGGTWAASVDQWNGVKHLAMQCLAAHAAAKAATASQLLRWMGRPDERLACPSAACEAFAMAPGKRDELWVYHWRGHHDRLGFVLRDGRVSSSAWAYVGE